MNNKILLSFVLSVSFANLFGMYLPIKVSGRRSATPSPRSFVFDRKAAQGDTRTPPPAVFDCAGALLAARGLASFAESFQGLSRINSPVADVDEREFIIDGESGLKYEGRLESDFAMGFGDSVSLDDLLDKLDTIASENYGQCAAIFVKGRYASIVAKKDMHWAFISLDRQSEKKHFAAGSHMAIFDTRTNMYSYLDSLCKKLSASSADDTWEATFYSKTSISHTPRCPLFERT